MSLWWFFIFFLSLFFSEQRLPGSHPIGPRTRKEKGSPGYFALLLFVPLLQNFWFVPQSIFIFYFWESISHPPWTRRLMFPRSLMPSIESFILFYFLNFIFLCRYFLNFYFWPLIFALDLGAMIVLSRIWDGSVTHKCLLWRNFIAIIDLFSFQLLKFSFD